MVDYHVCIILRHYLYNLYLQKSNMAAILSVIFILVYTSCEVAGYDKLIVPDTVPSLQSIFEGNSFPYATCSYTCNSLLDTQLHLLVSHHEY